MKLEAKDLRIGNLVMDNAKVKIVTSGMISNWDIIKRDYGGYKPIPLTEEWLVRFGFEKRYDYILPYQYSYQKAGLLLSEDFTMSDFTMYMTTYGKALKYVHTLQNLYHALNDEELTLNETI
jgi:hypothetical protein